MIALPSALRDHERPRMSNHTIDFSIAGFPADFSRCQAGIGDKHRRIAHATRSDLPRDLAAGDVLHSVDNAPYREALSISKIVGFHLARRKRRDSLQMGVRKIAYVNIVADAGAIGRRVVVA